MDKLSPYVASYKQRDRSRHKIVECDSIQIVIKQRPKYIVIEFLPVLVKP